MAEFAHDTFQEKTEEATPKKKDDSRRQGKVAKSAELNSATMIIAGLLGLYVGGMTLASQLTELVRSFLGGAAQMSVTSVNVQPIMIRAIGPVAIAVVPLLSAFLMIGLLSSYTQVGFLFSFEPLMFHWNRISPYAGMRRVFISQRSMVELVKNLAKVILIGAVAYVAVRNAIDTAPLLVDSDIPSLFGLMMQSSFAVGLKIGLAFLAVAVFDYAYQRYDYERDLRMTKQELKEESRSTEGDPLIKSRVRGIQRRIAYRRMMSEVPKADVIITNPTHYAVALKYDTVKNHAPTVVAKGADFIAEKIKALAREHHIPLVEDQPLARALYAAVEVGEEIPEKLFHAVAQVLAYVYRLRNTAVKPGMI